MLNDEINLISKDEKINIFLYSLILAVIIFMVDYTNIFLRSIFVKDRYLGILFFIIAIILIIFIMIKYRVKDYLKAPVLTFVDKFGYVLYLMVAFYNLLISVYQIMSAERMFTWYKMIIIWCISIYLFINLNERFDKLIDIEKRESINEYNVIDFKSIYNNDFKIESDKNKLRPIFIEEKEVGYDLLNRNIIIDDLFDILTNIRCENSFIIGIDGKWGSGKSTLIKNVKYRIEKDKEIKDKIIVIDDFEPWIFDNEEALFKSLFEKILYETELNIKYKDINEIIAIVVDTVFGSDKNIFRKLNKLDKVQEISKEINNYMAKTNRQYVFVFDNLDRLKSNNIYTLLTMISEVLNFDNIVYLLAYDKAEIDKIFDYELNINSNYFKKIVNMELTLPIVSNEIYEKIHNVCINNILNKLEVEDSAEISNIVSEHTSENLDMRDFKRYLNSIINRIEYNKIICIKDWLLLELIKYIDIGMYYEIYENCEYYISHNNKNIFIIFNSDSENDSMLKKYFGELDENKKMKTYSILKDLFPSIANYLEKDSGGKKSYYDLEKSNKNRNIDNGDYFEVYFTNNTNIHIKAHSNVKNIVNNLNNTEDTEDINQIVENELLNLKGQERDITLMLLTINIDNVKDIYLDLSLAIYEVSLRTDSFIMNDDVIVSLLKKVESEDLDIFIDKVSYMYKGLFKIENLNKKCPFGTVYYIEEEPKLNYLGESIEKLYINMCKGILENNIDIFIDENYTEYNFHSLVRGVDLFDMDNKRDIIRSYVNKILNVENIYRFMEIVIREGSGDHKGIYGLNKEIMDLVDTNIIDQLIENSNPQGIREKTIKEAYQELRLK